MSRGPDDLPPPRRPGPRPKPKGADDPGEFGDQPTTWRPSAAPRPPKTKATKARPKRAAEMLDDPTPETGGGPGWVERIAFGRVGTSHLAKFCRQFAAYQDAGVALVKSLASLQKQFARTALGPVLGRLEVSVRRGETLGDAMGREPEAFDPLFLSMIRVAEARGGIPETLRLMADHYEARLSLMRQARSAMIYPIVVLVVAGLVIGLLTVFVLPSMIAALDMQESALPAPTRLLIAFSKFMRWIGWWAVPLGMVGAFFGLLRIYRTPAGKSALDEISLYVPVLGLLLRKIDTARFARTLSTLLEAGVDLGASLDLTADVMHLAPFRRVVRGTRQAVIEGVEMSEALDASRRFSPDVIAILNSGEETGKIPESLAKLADDYEEQVAIMVKSLGSLVQPVLIVILGGIVFFVVVSFVMAYVAMLSNAMKI